MSGDYDGDARSSWIWSWLPCCRISNVCDRLVTDWWRSILPHLGQLDMTKHFPTRPVTRALTTLTKLYCRIAFLFFIFSLPAGKRRAAESVN